MPVQWLKATERILSSRRTGSVNVVYSVAPLMWISKLLLSAHPLNCSPPSMLASLPRSHIWGVDVASSGVAIPDQLADNMSDYDAPTHCTSRFTTTFVASFPRNVTVGFYLLYTPDKSFCVSSSVQQHPRNPQIINRTCGHPDGMANAKPF